MNKIANIINEIQNEWLGKSIFWSRKYGAQCTSVIKLYFKELGIKETPTGHAYQYIDHLLLQKYFDRVINPQRDIERGDIIVINRTVIKDNNGRNISPIPYGHVAICSGIRPSSPNTDNNLVSHIWLLEQDGSITDRNFDDERNWAKLRIGSRNLATISQVWKPNLEKIQAANQPKIKPVELVDKLSETSIPVRERVAEKVEDAPVLKVENQFAQVDKMDSTDHFVDPNKAVDTDKQATIELLENQADALRDDMQNMKLADKDRVNKRKGMLATKLTLTTAGVYGFLDERVPFFMQVEEWVGHDYMFNIIIPAIIGVIYWTLNNVVHKMKKQGRFVGVISEQLLKFVGDKEYSAKKDIKLEQLKDIKYHLKLLRGE